MTDADKTQIIKLRAKGFSYKKISAETGISENTIKSYFKRNTNLCPVCGNPLIGKKYCSDKCRISWWNKHPHRTSAMIECQCENCKKTFLLIQVRHENTVPKPVMANPAETRTTMTNERLQHIASYKVAIILFRKLLKNGTITESEFHRCESNIAEKCGLSLCSIYREIT